MGVVIGMVLEATSGRVGRRTGISVRKMKHSVVRQTLKSSGLESNKFTHLLVSASTTVVSKAKHTKGDKPNMVDDLAKLHQCEKFQV